MKLELFNIFLNHIPVKRQLLEVGEITGDVLEGSVSDPGAPGEVQTDQLPEVLRDQLDTIISDLAAPGQGEDGQIWQGMN